MPTKKKRVGFIPREDVMKIIEKLSIENNLSNSKIVSILVEEALSIRGIFNKKTGEKTFLYQGIKGSSQYTLKYSIDSVDDEKITNDTNSGKNKISGKTNVFQITNEETFDLQTYKKFLLFLKFQEMIDE